MKTPKEWREGWKDFLQRRTKDQNKVTVQQIDELQEEYIGRIQNNARQSLLVEIAEETKQLEKKV